LHVHDAVVWVRGLLLVCSASLLLAAVVHLSLEAYFLPSVASAALALVAAGGPRRRAEVVVQPV
jgi:hypothetical protein